MPPHNLPGGLVFRRRRRRIHTPPPPPFLPSGIFPLTSLPRELTLHIASFLDRRSQLALLRTSTALLHLSSIFTILSRRDQVVRFNGRTKIYTPLQYFASRGEEAIVARLLLEGADPNEVSFCKTKPQLSPLMHAIDFHSARIVSLLLKSGARVNDRDGWTYDNGPKSAARGFTPLHIAVGRPHHIHPQLLDDEHGYNARAAELPLIVKMLLEAGADVAAEHETRGTALHIACNARNADPLIVSTLIAAGADVRCRLDNSMDKDIQPIHYAACGGEVAIVRALLDAGVDVETRTGNGIRALDIALIGMSKLVVELLIESGADTSIALNDRGVAVLQSSWSLAALRNSHLSMVDLAYPTRLLARTVQPEMLVVWLVLRGWDALSPSMAPTVRGMMVAHDTARERG